jgi:hypothetical protein
LPLKPPRQKARQRVGFACRAVWSRQSIGASAEALRRRVYVWFSMLSPFFICSVAGVPPGKKRVRHAILFTDAYNAARVPAI